MTFRLTSRESTLIIPLTRASEERRVEMLIWVIILVVLSGFLFAQNVSLLAGEWQLPPNFWLTILWSVLMLLVALGILVSLVAERRAKGRHTERARPAAPKPPPAPGPEVGTEQPRPEPPRERPTEEPKEPSF